MAHFGDLERLRKDFDIKFGILKLLFGEEKIVGMNLRVNNHHSSDFCIE